MVDTRAIQARVDRALSDLTVAFTELLLFVEAVDTRLERLERTTGEHADRAAAVNRLIDEQLAENDAARKRLRDREAGL